MPVRRRRRHEHTLRFKPDLWGRETESGTVLFDGMVTLEDDGNSLKATIPGTTAPTVGHVYEIIFNGHVLTTYAAYLGDDGTWTSADASTVGFWGYLNGSESYLWCTISGASAGDEIALTITDMGMGFNVSPNTVSMAIGAVKYAQVTGTVASFESSDTSVATVEEEEGYEGWYIITGVGTGECFITFTSVGGDTASVVVSVIQIG